MNGRIYDPLLGRFLSPDVTVQFPGDLQSFNRYSYVQNNPLRYVDPTGFYLSDGTSTVTTTTVIVSVVVKTPSPVWLPVAAIASVPVIGIAVYEGVKAVQDYRTAERFKKEADENIERGKQRGTVPNPANPKPLVATPHEVKIDEGAIQSNEQGDKVNTTQSPNQEAKPDAPKQEPKKDDSKSSSNSKDSKSAASDKLVTNPKHHPNSDSPQPANVQDLYSRSMVDKNGVRWAVGADGTIHRFSRPSNGERHWNGSTAGAKPIKEQDIPNDIKKQLEEQLKKLKERK